MIIGRIISYAFDPHGREVVIDRKRKVADYEELNKKIVEPVRTSDKIDMTC